MTSNFYAIRHIPTGGFLPGIRRKHKGFTNDEPSTSLPPRLFTKKTAAAQALRYWLQGALVRSYYQSGEFGEELVEDTKLTPKPERKQGDMDIAEVNLRVVK